ncbi:modulator of smoothened protein-like [Clytia hemisphaerica]|uniref:Cnidarian restricted protein n=1 Tax=Clytia hemisphaerica TaxID=252671 RepID=A0A7M5X4S1_9CNID|eukprot:TCONS_00027185-protein
MSLDKKTIISSVLLVLSNSLAISSIGTPSWVENNFAGTTRLGLTKICVLFNGQDPQNEECEALKMPSYWAVTLIFIVIGICLIFLTVLLLLLSIWRTHSEKMARIIGFLAMLFFCVACIVFPFGFYIEEIGGQAYKLPAYTQVGYSYYLFCGAVSLLTAAVTLCNLDVIRENFNHRMNR